MATKLQEKSEVSCEQCSLHEVVLDADSQQMIGLIVLTQKHKADKPSHKPRLTVISVTPEPRGIVANSKENV